MSQDKRANTTHGTGKKHSATNSARSQQNALPCAGWFCGHSVISSFPSPYCLNNEIVLRDTKEKGTINAKNHAGKNQGTLDEQAPAKAHKHSPAAPREAEMGSGVILLNYLHVVLFTEAQQLDLFQECLLKHCPFSVLLPEDQFSPEDFQEVALACNFPWMPILQNNLSAIKNLTVLPISTCCSLILNFTPLASAVYTDHTISCVVASQLINPAASLGGFSGGHAGI